MTMTDLCRLAQNVTVSVLVAHHWDPLCVLATLLQSDQPSKRHQECLGEDLAE